jgi:hypothetical protein
MKAQDHIKNDEINLQADHLLDLPVADKQAEATKGGERGHKGTIELASWSFSASNPSL